MAKTMENTFIKEIALIVLTLYAANTIRIMIEFIVFAIHNRKNKIWLKCLIKATIAISAINFLISSSLDMLVIIICLSIVLLILSAVYGELICMIYNSKTQEVVFSSFSPEKKIKVISYFYGVKELGKVNIYQTQADEKSNQTL